MTTKNKSVFEPTKILVSRKEYDRILAKHPDFLNHLLGTYYRTWSLAGISFHNVDSKDFITLFKLLA